MSTLIHRYSPSENVLLNSQRAKERRFDACSTLTPRGGSAGAARSLQRVAGSGSACRQSTVSVDRRHVHLDHQKMNVELIREVEERNKLNKETQKLAHMSTQIAEDVLRAQHSGGRRRPSREELASISPRKLVRDMSATAQREDDAYNGHANQRRERIPEYLVHRIEEQREQKAMEAQAVAVAESERGFPKGQEPLNPDVTERTREFLEIRVAELDKQLRDFSFRSGCSILGQRKKADLEQQLRDAETALARFNFPVVFVRCSKPRPVLERRRTHAK